MSGPRIAVKPSPAPFAIDAVVGGGGTVVDDATSAEGLVWLDPFRIGDLAELLHTASDVRWVQLPFAGIERVVDFRMKGNAGWEREKKNGEGANYRTR